MEPDPLTSTPIRIQHQNFCFIEEPWRSATCNQCGFYAPIDDDQGQCRFFEWTSDKANLIDDDDPACPRFTPHRRTITESDAK